MITFENPVCVPILVGGPSGIGKTTMVNSLIRLYPDCYQRPISLTSRPRREGEDCSEYSFVPAETILNAQRAGDLLNCDHVYGHLYAILRTSLQEILTSGRCPIKEVHPHNFAPIRTIYPQAVTSLVVPADLLRAPSDNHDMPESRSDDWKSLPRRYIDLSDVILPTADEPVHERALSFHTRVQAHLASSAAFPPPSAIDASNASGYSAIAPAFTEDKRVTTAYFHKLSLPFLASAHASCVTPNARVLEVGPGNGWLISALHLVSNGYVGADISQEMIDVLAARFPGRCFMRASARALPFPAEAFDIIMCSLADSYFYPAALCELSRVLHPQGAMIMTMPAAAWARGIRRPEEMTRTTFSLLDGPGATVFSFALDPADLAACLRLAGLTVTRHEVMRGELPAPDMVTRSAQTLGVAVHDLAIVDCLLARKT